MGLGTPERTSNSQSVDVVSVNTLAEQSPLMITLESRSLLDEDTRPQFELGSPPRAISTRHTNNPEDPMDTTPEKTDPTPSLIPLCDTNVELLIPKKGKYQHDDDSPGPSASIVAQLKNLQDQGVTPRKITKAARLLRDPSDSDDSDTVSNKLVLFREGKAMEDNYRHLEYDTPVYLDPFFAAQMLSGLKTFGYKASRSYILQLNHKKLEKSAIMKVRLNKRQREESSDDDMDAKQTENQRKPKKGPGSLSKRDETPGGEPKKRAAILNAILEHRLEKERGAAAREKSPMHLKTTTEKRRETIKSVADPSTETKEATPTKGEEGSQGVELMDLEDNDTRSIGTENPDSVDNTVKVDTTGEHTDLQEAAREGMTGIRRMEETQTTKTVDNNQPTTPTLSDDTIMRSPEPKTVETSDTEKEKDKGEKTTPGPASAESKTDEKPKPKMGKPGNTPVKLKPLPWDCSDIRLDPDFKERMAKFEQDKAERQNKLATTIAVKEKTTTTKRGECLNTSKIGRSILRRYPLKDTSNAFSVLLPAILVPKSFKPVNNV